MTVTKVIPVPVERVWSIFTDLAGRPNWMSEVDSVEVLSAEPFGLNTTWREIREGPDGEPITAELVITAVELGRSCTMAVAGTDAGHLSYLFAPIDVGPNRGSTAVTAIVEGGPHRLTDRVLGFVVGTFAARTAEGALRDELDALAAACVTDERVEDAAA